MCNKIIALSNTVNIILHTFSIRNVMCGGHCTTVKLSIYVGLNARRLMFIKCYRFNSTLDSAAKASIECLGFYYIILLWAQYDRWVIGRKRNTHVPPSISLKLLIVQFLLFHTFSRDDICFDWTFASLHFLFIIELYELLPTDQARSVKNIPDQTRPTGYMCISRMWFWATKFSFFSIEWTLGNV